jgi:general secretion pathway protein I
MKQKGFTLIEVMISLAILAGGIILLASSWSGNLMRIRKSNMYSSVATLLERKMIELDAEYKDKPVTEVPKTRSGDFGSELPLYRWEMKSRELKFPDLSAVMVGKDGGADETMIMMIRQVTDQLSKAIKEIKVTVFVKTPKKEMEFSATQYLIDYDQGMTGLPGAGGAPAPATPAGGK